MSLPITSPSPAPSASSAAAPILIPACYGSLPIVYYPPSAYPTHDRTRISNYVLKNACQVSSSSSSALSAYLDVFVLPHPNPDLRWSHSRLITSLGQEIFSEHLTAEAKSNLIFFQMQEQGIIPFHFALPAILPPPLPPFAVYTPPMTLTSSDTPPIVPSDRPRDRRERTVAIRTAPIFGDYETKLAPQTSSVADKVFKTTPIPVTSITERLTCPFGFCDFVIENGYNPPPAAAVKAAEDPYQDVYVTLHTQPKLRWSHCRYITSSGKSISIDDLNPTAKALIQTKMSAKDATATPASSASAASKTSRLSDSSGPFLIATRSAISRGLAKIEIPGPVILKHKDTEKDVTSTAESELIRERNIRPPKKHLKSKSPFFDSQQTLSNAYLNAEGALVDVTLFTYKKGPDSISCGKSPYKLVAEEKTLAFENLTEEGQAQFIKTGTKPYLKARRSSLYALLKKAYLVPSSDHVASCALDVQV